MDKIHHIQIILLTLLKECYLKIDLSNLVKFKKFNAILQLVSSLFHIHYTRKIYTYYRRLMHL